MKTLVAVTIGCLLSVIAFAQNEVNIELTSQNSSICEVTLSPSYQDIGVISNVVFALKWRAGQRVAFGDPAPSVNLTIERSGSVQTWEGWNYQFYSGCGLVNGPIETLIVSIPYSGRAEFTLANDDFVGRSNGRFFVSIGGEDVTGRVSTKKSYVDSDNQTITLFYDRMQARFLLKREGVFYDLIGQGVVVYNESELVVVRKLN